MLNVKEKVAVRMTGAAVLIGHAQTDMKVRDTVGIVGEPKAGGNTNFGPTPTEMLKASLTAWVTAISKQIAVLSEGIRKLWPSAKVLRAEGTKLYQTRTPVLP
jgi:hypothetical protein